MTFTVEFRKFENIGCGQVAEGDLKELLEDEFKRGEQPLSMLYGKSWSICPTKGQCRIHGYRIVPLCDKARYH